MHAWTSTLDTKEAAAWATLGGTVKIESTLAERTSIREVRFHLGEHGGPYQLGKLRAALRDGSLQRTDPAHPLLTILRAFANRERLLALLKDGARLRLVAVPGAAGIWQYAPGEHGLPGVAGNAAIVKTTDLKIVAALATCGMPLLHLEPGAGGHRFACAAHAAHAAPAAAMPWDGAQLVAAWRRSPDEVPWQLPFAQAMRGLVLREQLLAEVRRSVDSVLLHKPGTRSHAIIRADAAPRAWDRTARFFRGI